MSTTFPVEPNNSIRSQRGFGFFYGRIKQFRGLFLLANQQTFNSNFYMNFSLN